MINDLMEKVVSLCKRRGFVFQDSEIYGGLAGMWDWGHYGVRLKENISRIWWQKFVHDEENIFGLDTAIIMNQKCGKLPDMSPGSPSRLETASNLT